MCVESVGFGPHCRETAHMHWQTSLAEPDLGRHAVRVVNNPVIEVVHVIASLPGHECRALTSRQECHSCRIVNCTWPATFTWNMANPQWGSPNHPSLFSLLNHSDPSPSQLVTSSCSQQRTATGHQPSCSSSDTLERHAQTASPSLGFGNSPGPVAAASDPAYGSKSGHWKVAPLMACTRSLGACQHSSCCGKLQSNTCRASCTATL